MSKIIRNAVKFQDGTIIESRHRHDFKCYAGLCVDGGLDYIRRVGTAEMPVEDISVYTDSPGEDIREGFSWGSYGKNGDEPLHHIKLKDMTTSHIEAILRTQHHISEYVRQMFYKELEGRGFDSFPYMSDEMQRCTGMDLKSKEDYFKLYGKEF